jgi:DNA-directed RNA polymerase specialized sigma24 family protein
MDEENPASLRAKISHYRQMLRMVDDHALHEALAVLIRVTQEKLANFALATQVGPRAKPETQGPPATLGDVLYAKINAPVGERDWESLVRSMAAGDQVALQALYERAHDIVLSYAGRMTGGQERAEVLTTDVFDDLWRYAADYDSANTTVIGWIMKQTRLRGGEHRRLETHASQTDCLPPLLVTRNAQETGQRWSEPEWEGVAPGIECKLLATDTERHRVSMLVRLAPDADYPAHTHSGTEELYLLDGELWIDGRKLVPGDYNYGAPGTGDERVWSETGCTCVLITSTQDRLH